MNTFAFSIVFVTIFTVTLADDDDHRATVKRSYVCPPHFIRLSHRCYFFSKESVPWQVAHFKCRDMHSQLAIIKNSNQDKYIRRMLNKNRDGNEWWLGAVYDWQQMSWKWATPGKPLTYNGFPAYQTDNEAKDALRWHCIVMDPARHFMWNHKNCMDMNRFICHTRIKTVNSKGKKKLQKQYNANKYNKLNEIPVPVLPEDRQNQTSGVKSLHNFYKFEINNDVMGNAQYANKPKKRMQRKRNKIAKRVSNPPLYNNGTNYESFRNNLVNRRRRKYNLNEERIRYKTYKENKAHPLYPRPIVEEYSFNNKLIDS